MDGLENFYEDILSDIFCILHILQKAKNGIVYEWLFGFHQLFKGEVIAFSQAYNQFLFSQNKYSGLKIMTIKLFNC